MTYNDTVGEDGEITIPKPVRRRRGIEEGDTVLFRFDTEAGVRLVPVPTDPMDRLEDVRDRASDVDADATELLESEREEW